ncbi:MAG: hypothetical protein MUQ72_08130, partial [Flavobacteriaceae bacterium]|nr:hypothetical protein [Flavobacteriaceae bacterium]
MGHQILILVLVDRSTFLIFALATPVAQSALAIFRASGSGCVDSFNSVLSEPISSYREVCLRDILWEGVLVDRCSVVFY